MRSVGILVLSFLLQSGILLAQQKAEGKNCCSLQMPSYKSIQENRLFKEEENSSKKISEFEPKPFSVKENFATQKLPFFCSQELHWEQKTHVPLRIRMGSLAQTDWLEQKPNAQAPR